MTKEPMTKEGYDKTAQKLKELKLIEKPQILKAVDEARQLGDLKENAEYHAAKEQQANCEKQIARLEDIISKAVIIDPAKIPHDKVNFGSTVVLIDIQEDKEIVYKIVGSQETDINQNKISFHSPLAKQLLRKEVGDEIIATLPGGEKEFEIEEIYYDDQ
ncbi:MAG: transcription elongation factor GreA [Campylobacteraceae bacterium 4484_166]|nr:MAG: transcription elongation factor GreA [Campylobacteraceae bacterium 4484_166]